MHKHKSIFKLFLYSKQLRFSEIEEKSKIRSNELAYYLKRLQAKGVLEKQGDYYVLTENAQKHIPYFQENDVLSPLPVVLVRCENEGKVLLIRRNKRPYEGLWSMPGGRIILGESIEQTAKRVLKEKTFLECEFVGVRAVCNERVQDNGIKHGFVLFVADVRPSSTIKEKTDVRWLDSKTDSMVPSDQQLLNAEPGFYECTLLPQPQTEPTEYSIVLEKVGAMTSNVF